MAKMYLESNNAGLDILITDENGNWWYSEIDNGGYYGDAEIYCDGETKEERINAALENLRREICFHNDIELCVGGEIVLRDEDGNDIDSFTE